MMKKVKVLILMIITSVLLNGCYDYKRLADAIIVSGIAIQKEGDDKYRIMTESIKDSVTKGDSAKGVIYEAVGEGFADAVENIYAAAPGTINLDHCDFIIIDEEIAKDGLAQIVDTIIRNKQFDINMNILISPHETTLELLNIKPKVKDIISEEIENIIENRERRMTNILKVSSIGFYSVMGQPYSSAVLPVIDIEDGEISITRSAYFKLDGMEGYIDREGVRALSFITNNIKRSYLEKKNQAGRISFLDVWMSKDNITPELSGDSIKMNIELSLQGSLDEPAVGEKYSDEPGIKKQVADFNAELEKEINNFVSTQKQTGCDVFGFSKAFEKKYRKEWNKYKDDWPEHLKNMEVSVKSNIRISDSNLLVDEK
jgi:spore germination protein KC